MLLRQRNRLPAQSIIQLIQNCWNVQMEVKLEAFT